MSNQSSSKFDQMHMTNSTSGKLDDYQGYWEEEGALEDYDAIVWSAVEPNWLEYASLAIFALLLITGLVGNFLVMFVVLRNESMRTVTNYFLLNLALADFMVLLFCLPFTILWEITKTWWFGTALCKIIVYVQTLSVSVSILTLTCISTERWHAICHPLSFKNTFKRTRISLVVIWLSASLLSLPEIIILKAKPFAFAKPNYTSPYLTQCTHTWDDSLQQVYQLAQTLALYVIPFCMITAMYGHIAYVLWVKSVPPSDCASTPRSTLLTVPQTNHQRRLSSKSASALNPTSNEYLPVQTCDDAESISIDEKSNGQDRPKRSPVLSASRRSTLVSNGGSKSINSVSPEQWKEREIMNRRKAAKMLIAVVVLFAICYLPTHVLNILTYFGAVPDLKLGLQRSAMYLSIRFMCYFNSCINPIVYNFMSEKFQKEFQLVFRCIPRKYRRPSLGKQPSRHQNYEASALLAPTGRNPHITNL